MNAQLHSIEDKLNSKEISCEPKNNINIVFSKMCRTCLAKTEDYDLRSEPKCIINGKLVHLYELFELATGLKMASNDILPLYICASCLESIKRFYNFRIQSERSDQILQSVLQTLKSEQSDSNEDIHSKDIEVIISDMKQLKEELPEEQPEDKQSGNESENNLQEENLQNQNVPQTEHNHGKSPEKMSYNNLYQISIKEEIVDEIKTELDDEEFAMDEKFQREDLIEIKTEFDDKEFAMDENFQRNDPIEISCKPIFNEPLDQQIEVIHNKVKPDPIKILCQFCESSFKPKDLNRHIRINHKVLSCKFCKSLFTRARDFKEHIELYHSKVDPEAAPIKYVCKICKAVFYQPLDLNRHIELNHSNLEPDQFKFSCRFCKSTFNRTMELNRHIKYNHSDVMSELFKYSCKFCKSVFKRQSDLNQHLEVEHPKLKRKQPKNMCTFCNSVFFRERDLNRHIGIKHPQQIQKAIETTVFTIEE